MRKTINKCVLKCPVCALHRISRSQKEDDGEHIVTEPSLLLVCDIAGPYHGAFRTPSGAPRYVFIAVDAFSRYAIGVVLSSTNDDEVFRAFMEIRRQMAGFPAKVSADNALLRERSRTRKFLEENNVRILHGLPTVSRCQSKAERTIGTISKLFIKYHTANPSLAFNKLVDEAVLAPNSSPHDGLPNGLSPRDVHFTRAPKSFLRAQPEVDPTAPPSIRNTIDAARALHKDVIRHDVMTFTKRQEKRSPTNYTSRMKTGDLALQKRTSFPSHVPKKLAFKTIIDAYEVTAKTGTNNFRVVSLLTGEQHVVAGDLLIKVRGLSKEDLIALCEDMERVAARNSAQIGARVTRSATRHANISSVSQLFISTNASRCANGEVYTVSPLFE